MRQGLPDSRAWAPQKAVQLSGPPEMPAGCLGLEQPGPPGSELFRGCRLGPGLVEAHGAASGQGRPPVHLLLGFVLQTGPSQIPGRAQQERPTWSASLVSGRRPPGLRAPTALACWVPGVGRGGGVGECLR